MPTSFMNNGVMVCGGTVRIDGKRLPPCPAEHNSITIINRKVYIGGYEWKNGSWKRTWRALWHLMF